MGAVSSSAGPAIHSKSGHSQWICFAGEGLVEGILKDLRVASAFGEKGHGGAEFQIIGAAEDLLDRAALDGIDKAGAFPQA
jgi:hypothetical protein